MTDSSATRDRLLDAAETLFTRHGYAGVRLRDLEETAGVHHSTFYHHAPGGKTQLYVEAMERSLARHEAALVGLMQAHQGNLQAQLYAAAEWVLANPAGNHTRMLSTDFARLPAEAAQRLGDKAFQGLISPLAHALRAALQSKQATFDPNQAEVIAGGLIAALQALQAAYERYPDATPALERAQLFIDVLLSGLVPRVVPAPS